MSDGLVRFENATMGGAVFLRPDGVMGLSDAGPTWGSNGNRPRTQVYLNGAGVVVYGEVDEVAARLGRTEDIGPGIEDECGPYGPDNGGIDE